MGPVQWGLNGLCLSLRSNVLGLSSHKDSFTIKFKNCFIPINYLHKNMVLNNECNCSVASFLQLLKLA